MIECCAGVAWSVGTGFITLTLDLGLNKVLVRRALTRDAVLSTVAYTGAAAVLLHRSLDAQQVRATCMRRCRKDWGCS